MKQDKNEIRWDKLLKIRTTGRDDSKADQYRYPYEPTPYSVLERLANSGLIRKNNTLIDYGCGKGRVDYFMAYQTKCKSIGIEYDEPFNNNVWCNNFYILFEKYYDFCSCTCNCSSICNYYKFK